MFTGIIESQGKVKALKKEQGNLHITIQSPFTPELKINQSIAHNGACLSIVDLQPDSYTVTAVEETLNKTNLKHLKPGDTINLERCLKLGDRLDGHMVQGHVDTVAVCSKIKESNGSWMFTFTYDDKENVTVEKGSISVNGVSLTVVDSGESSFSIAIIPYTYQHTNFQFLKVGDEVNIEFDMLGKYITRLMEKRLENTR